MSKVLSFCLLWLNLLYLQATAFSEIKGALTKSVAADKNDHTAKCTVMKCKVICFNGKSCDIEKDARTALKNSHMDCPVLEELRLYNYEFPNAAISKNFLGGLTNKIKSIYIATSNVTDIEGGAFGNGIFHKILFENLHLTELRRDFFTKISRDFQSLSIIQNDYPVQVIHRGFLDFVQSRIRALTIQVGITCVDNVTGSSSLLSNLAHLDLSRNDFGNSLLEKSFSMLSMVENLDLSHSKLTALPKYIFSTFVRTLTFLDVSHNNIKTISTEIFGWQRRRPELKIIVNNNDWFCDCKLKNNIKEIFGPHPTKIYCAAPEEYRNLAANDNRICAESKPTKKGPTTIAEFIPNQKLPANVVPTTNNPAPATTSTTATTTRTSPTITTDGQEAGAAFDRVPSADQGIINNVNFICGKSTSIMLLKRPKISFSIMKRPNLRVDIGLKASNSTIADFGLIWFSKVTKEYYDMEVNYNEYGLGCYSPISYLSSVENLTPNVAYTFCLVKKSRPTVFPSDCKSVHISSNLSIHKGWVTRDLRFTGISLTILGIVLCTFTGICISFVILKHKPILLKNSKRVAITKRNINEIVVLPKDCSRSELRFREKMLAKRSSRSNVSATLQRRSSSDSDDSYQSYINTNLYEELPAYIAFATNIRSIPSILNEDNNDYISPLAIGYHPSQSLSYAEIPFRRKRSSNDPLPEIPKEDTLNWPSKVEGADITEHHLKSPTGYAFAYDCVV